MPLYKSTYTYDLFLTWRYTNNNSVHLIPQIGMKQGSFLPRYQNLLKNFYTVVNFNLNLNLAVQIGIEGVYEWKMIIERDKIMRGMWSSLYFRKCSLLGNKKTYFDSEIYFLQHIIYFPHFLQNNKILCQIIKKASKTTF